MISACAWCEKQRTPEQRAADAIARAGQEVTHGICEPHAAELRRQMVAWKAKRQTPVAA
jgi:hypothetical protein